MLYQAVWGRHFMGWVTFTGYVTLSSHGNFTQTDAVYPSWVGYQAVVWLPKLGKVFQDGLNYPA